MNDEGMSYAAIETAFRDAQHYYWLLNKYPEMHAAHFRDKPYWFIAGLSTAVVLREVGEICPN